MGKNVQAGFQKTPVANFPGFASDAKGASKSNDDTASGFEAILDALVNGDANNVNAAQQINAELGQLTANGEVEMDMSAIKEALKKLKEALTPIAAAFDQLLVPSPQQIADAQNALANLAKAVNSHPNRYDAATSLPMGLYTDQFGALRQAENVHNGPGDLPQLGKLLKNLNTLLGNMDAQNGKANQTNIDAQLAALGTEADLSANENKKPSLNMHEMIRRLENLAEKLPETAQATVAKLVGKKMGLDGDALSNLAANSDVHAKKELQNGKGSNLLTAALEGTDASRNADFADARDSALAQNQLMADQRYAAQRSATNLAETAKMASDLDMTETAGDKILNIQRSEQLQQTQIQMDKLVHQQAPQRQINLPAMAFEVVRQLRNGTQQFEIRLDPPELGKVDVQLEMDGKNVTARLTVERAETLDLLQRDQRALERALQQAGLNTDKANLQFSLRQDQQGGQRQQFAQQQDQHQSNANAESDTAASNSQSITESPSLVLRGTARPDGLNLWV